VADDGNETLEPDLVGHVRALFADYGENFRCDTVYVDLQPDPNIVARSIAVEGGRAEFDLLPGAHVLEWSILGVGWMSRRVDVRAGETVELDLRSVPLTEFQAHPQWARVELTLTDRGGVPLAGARVRVHWKRREGERIVNRYNLGRVTDDNGCCWAALPRGTVRLSCGDWSETLEIEPGGVYIVAAPGAQAEELGELAILGDAVVRVALDSVDGKDVHPAAADIVEPRPKRQRFLWRRPGRYRILEGYAEDPSATVATVHAGEVTEVALDSAEIVLRPAVVNGTDVPAMLTATIRGLTRGASHAEGYRVFFTTKGNETRVPVKPGTYLVETVSVEFPFSMVFVVRGGGVVDVMVTLGKHRSPPADDRGG
jgi:hypothetical protein